MNSRFGNRLISQPAPTPAEEETEMINPHISELMVTARQADIRRAAANHRSAGRPRRGDATHRVRKLFAPRHRRVVLSVVPG